MVEIPARKLRDVVHDALQKIPVVRDHDQPAPEFFQPVLQPLHHFGIQMVRRLVEHQHVRRVDERCAQGRTAAFAARKRADPPVGVRKTELRQHTLGLVFVQLPEFRRHTGKDLLQNGQLISHIRILCKHADLQIRLAGDRPAVRLELSGQNLQKCRLSGAVDADHAGLVALVQIKIHIVQQLTAAEIDGKMLCGYQHKFPPARGFCVYSITVFAGNHALLAFLPGFWYHGGEKHGIEVRFQ